MADVSQRLFLGSLHSGVTTNDVQELFNKFGKVSDAVISVKRDSTGGIYKSFAHVTISGQQENIDKAIKVLNNTRWKQGRISIEKAKESFLEKLKREREEAKKLENAKAPADDAYQIDEHSEMRKFMKGTPGTKIPSKQDWVIGKFGRMLPVVNLEKNRKIVEIDPSQYTHTLKKLDNPKHESEHSAAKPVESLTWRLPEVDSDISRRRQGQFPEYHPPKKRRRRLPTPPPVDSLNIEVVKSVAMPPRQNIIEVEAANPGCRVYNSDSDNDMDTSTQNDNLLGVRTHQLSTPVTPVTPGCRVYESDSEDGMSVDKSTQPVFNGKEKESTLKGSRPTKKRKKKRGKADKSLITGVGKTPITNGNAESMSDIESSEDEATPTISKSVRLDKVVQTEKKTAKKTKSEKLKSSENNSSVKLKVTNNKSDSMSDIISDIEETKAQDLGAGASNNDNKVMPNGAQDSVMQDVIHKRTHDASEESDQQSDYDPTDFFSSPTVQNTPRLSEQNPFEHEEEAGTVDYQFDSIPKQWDYTTHDFKTGQTNALTLTRSEYWKKLKELKAKIKADEDDDETNVEQLQKTESLEMDAFDQEASVDSSDEEQGSDAEYQSFMEASDGEEEIDGPEFKSEEESSASEAADSDDVLQDGDDDSEEDGTSSDDSNQADDVDEDDVGVTVDINSDDQQYENRESEASEQDEEDEVQSSAGMMANSDSALIESDESDISDLERDDESEVNDEQLISDEEELSDEVDVKSENIGTEPGNKYIYDPRLQEGVISDKESYDECSSDLNDSSVKNEVSDVESVDSSEVEDSDDEDSSDREGFVGTYGQGDSDDTTSESAEGNQDSDDASSESSVMHYGDDSEQDSDDASGESRTLNQDDDIALDSDDASGESITLNLDDSALLSDDASGESVTLNHGDDSEQDSDDASRDGKSDLDTSEVESPESEQQLDHYYESSPSDGSVTLGSESEEDSDSDEDQENENSEVMESENDADVESNSEDDEMMQQSDVDNESHDEEVQSDSASDEEVQSDSASNEEVQSDSASDEEVHSDSASHEEVHSDSASHEEVHSDSASNEEVHSVSASNEEVQSDSASDEEVQSDSASNAENQECDENGVSDSDESDYGNMKAQATSAKEKKGDLKFTIVKNDASMTQSEPLVSTNQSTSRPVNQSKTDDYYSSDDGEDLLDLLKSGADQKMHNYLTTQLKGKQLNEYKKQTAKVLAAEANRNLKNKQETDLTKKQKIEKIQQKIGGDSRFKVNEKFLEKDRGTITKVAVGDLDSDEELEQERSKTLDIIENITGKSVSREKKARNTFQSTAQQRYDPTKKGHGKLEVKVTKKTKKKKHEEPAPVVAKEQFYNVESMALKNIFSSKTESNKSGGFSFTSAIDPSVDNGAEHTTEAVQSPSEAEPMCTDSTDRVQDEESGAEESPDDVVMKPADSRFALSALFKDDHKPADSGTAADEEEHNYPEDRFPNVDPEMYSSSEGEGESDEEESDQSEVATDKKLDDRLDFNAMVKPVSFFIRDGDPRIKAGFEFFKSTQTKEKIESVWLSRKDILAKSYEKQAKSSEHSKPKGVGVAQSSLRKAMPFFK